MIIVLSKAEFDQKMLAEKLDDKNIEDSRMFFISLNNSHGVGSQSWFHNDHKNIIRLFFDDIMENDPSINDPHIVLFNDKHAKKIIDFSKQLKEQDEIVVHCFAGISRSGAVGLWLSRLLNDLNFLERHPHIHPNNWVLRTLNRVHENKPV